MEIHIIFDNVFDVKDDDKKKSLNKWVANFCEILWTKVTELDRANAEEAQKDTENPEETNTSFLDMMNPRILPTPYGGRKVVVYVAFSAII